MNQEVQPADYQHKAGALLKEARQKLGLGNQEIAQQLRVSVKVIDALEKGEPSDIPLVYRRGYMRHYASLVGLDHSSLDMLEPAGDHHQSDRPLVRRIPVEQGSRWFEQSLKVASYAIVTAGVVIPLVWVFTQGALELSFDDSMQPPLQTAEVESLSLDISATDSENADMQPPALLSLPGASNSTSALSASAAPFARINRANDNRLSGAASPVEVAPGLVVVAPGTHLEPEQEYESQATDSDSAEVVVDKALTDAVENTDTLVLSLLDGSWVEITDAEGEKLEFDLLQAGQEKTYTGIAPFEIIFGQASAVDLTLNGEKVDLSPYTRSDVATVLLPSNKHRLDDSVPADTADYSAETNG